MNNLIVAAIGAILGYIYYLLGRVNRAEDRAKRAEGDKIIAEAGLKTKGAEDASKEKETEFDSDYSDFKRALEDYNRSRESGDKK